MSGSKQYHDEVVLYDVFSTAAARDGISWCKYADESKKVCDARLVERGDTGMDGHHQVLAQTKEKVGCWNLGRKAAESAAGKVFDLSLIHI